MKRIIWFLIIFNIPSISNAESYLVNSWFVDTDNPSMFYAATISDTGTVFGQYCFSKSQACVYLIGMSTACVKGTKYSVLANSDAGSSYHEIYCDTQLSSGLYRYIFTNFDSIDNLVKSASRIGFAMPLKNDQFIVLRYNLSGAAKAVTQMKNKADLLMYKKERKKGDHYL